MEWKALDIWRGAARLWIVAIGIIEVAAIAIYLQPAPPDTGGRVRPLPVRGQSSSDLETIAGLVGMVLLIALAGYVGWRAIRWIVKGFQPTE